MFLPVGLPHAFRKCRDDKPQRVMAKPGTAASSASSESDRIVTPTSDAFSPHAGVGLPSSSVPTSSVAAVASASPSSSASIPAAYDLRYASPMLDYACDSTCRGDTPESVFSTIAATWNANASNRAVSEKRMEAIVTGLLAVGALASHHVKGVKQGKQTALDKCFVSEGQVRGVAPWLEHYISIERLIVSVSTPLERVEMPQDELNCCRCRAEIANLISRSKVSPSLCPFCIAAARGGPTENHEARYLIRWYDMQQRDELVDHATTFIHYFETRRRHCGLPKTNPLPAVMQCVLTVPLLMLPASSDSEVSERGHNDWM